MIDRYYLPFESARYFQDRGMAKWMGFFYQSIPALWMII